ncbi:MAG: FixH family protein [Caldilineaceae bacterium]|nr:FixH family protein [Caldilineaceae bacterium]
MMNPVARWRKIIWGNRAWVYFLLLLSVTVMLAACSGRSTTRDDSGLQVTLIPAPEGYGGTYLTIQLADGAGAPITDATVHIEGNMNHPGMAPVFSEAAEDGDDGAVDGSYQTPFAFNMLGDWILTVSIERPDGSQSKHDINVRVGDPQVEVRGQ